MPLYRRNVTPAFVRQLVKPDGLLVLDTIAGLPPIVLLSKETKPAIVETQDLCGWGWGGVRRDPWLVRP